MWSRLHGPRLTALARQFPALLILGSRQVGKATLARGPAVLNRKPPAGTGAPVLYEVQCVPEVLAALRGLIDDNRRRTGCHAARLTSEPLQASRMALGTDFSRFE